MIFVIILLHTSESEEDKYSIDQVFQLRGVGDLFTQSADVVSRGIFMDKCKVGCPRKKFSNLKNIGIDHPKNAKKISKNPWHAPSTWGFSFF